MRLSIIAALTAIDHVIGIENRLPWHLPADLKHFKALTLGKPILMGRKTFESIGKPLPGRRNIIISRNSDLVVPGCEVVSSFTQALELTQDCAEVMVIGGAQLFALALPKADVLYLTLVHEKIAGDCFFPAWNSAEWCEVSRQDYAPDAQNACSYSFVTLKRQALKTPLPPS